MMVTLSAWGSFSAPGLKFMLCYLSVSIRPCQVHVGSCSVWTASLCAAQLSPCPISPPSFPFHSGSIVQSSPFKVCLCSLPCVKVPCPPYHSSPLAHSHPCFPFSIHLVFPSASLGCPLLLPLPPFVSLHSLLRGHPKLSSLQCALWGCSSRSWPQMMSKLILSGSLVWLFWLDLSL